MGVRTAAAHALLLGGLGAYLTFVYTSNAGEAWTVKDYVFVAAVMFAVFYNRLSTMKYETLAQHAHSDKRRRAVAPLDRLEWVRGPPLQFETNKVTVVLFFGTWCRDSRAALLTLERLRKTITHGAVNMVALTQESREELAAYEVKGRDASHFKELKDLPFSIAIEDGFVSKELLVRFEIYHIPHVFVIGKDLSVVWYGAPSHSGLDEIIRGALAAENVALPEAKETPEEEEEVDDQQTAFVAKKKDN